MANVTITYYALLREARGLSQEQCDTPAATAAELYDALATEHGFRYPRERLKVAINDAFVDWSASLNDGDRVAFIPPVAGG